MQEITMFIPPRSLVVARFRKLRYASGQRCRLHLSLILLILWLEFQETIIG